MAAFEQCDRLFVSGDGPLSRTRVRLCIMKAGKCRSSLGTVKQMNTHADVEIKQ